MPEHPTPKGGDAIQRIPLGLLVPSLTNRPDRSGFDGKSLTELANSILQHGIIEPLIVRQNPRGKGFEIVCGERRWTGAKLAKLDTAPAIVRELDDRQAREIQIIENLQREGLHEIEDARGYYDLLTPAKPGEKPLHTIESLSRKIGKSPAFIYGRLKLLKMPEVAIKAFYVSKLSASNALLLCRIPNPKIALKATLEILDPQGSGDGPEREKRALDREIEPMSYRQAKLHISTNYMIRLKGCKFDQEDEELVPVQIVEGERIAGGKCSDCPWRTGNMAALFPDADSADVCTNTDCFKRKTEAAWKRAEAKAKAEGHTLLRDAKANQMFQDGRLSTAVTEYVDLRATFPGEKKKTWDEVLGDKVPEQLVQARDDKNKLHYLVPVAEAIEAAKKAGRSLAKGTKEQQAAASERDEAGTMDHRKLEQDRALRRKRAELIATAIGSAVFKKAEHTKPTADWWRWVVAGLAFNNEETWAQRFGFENFRKELAKASDETCRAMVVSILFMDTPVSWQGEINESILKAAEFYKVDAKKIAADLNTQFKAQDKAADKKEEKK